MAFDPDAFLKADSGFDPNAHLSETIPNAPTKFDPDAFLASPSPPAREQTTNKIWENIKSAPEDIINALKTSSALTQGILAAPLVDAVKSKIATPEMQAGRVHAAEESIVPTAGAMAAGSSAVRGVMPYVEEAAQVASRMPGYPGMIAKGLSVGIPVVTGLAAAVPTGMALQKGQEALLEKFPGAAELFGLEKTQREKERAADPYGEAVAGALPGFAFASPGSISKLSDLGYYGVNAGIQAGLNIGSQLYENGGDWKKVQVGPAIAQAVVGAAQMNPTALGEATTYNWGRGAPGAPNAPSAPTPRPALPNPNVEPLDLGVASSRPTPPELGGPEAAVPPLQPTPPRNPSRNMDAELNDLLGIKNPEIPPNEQPSVGTVGGSPPKSVGVSVLPSESGRAGVTGIETARLGDTGQLVGTPDEGTQGKRLALTDEVENILTSPRIPFVNAVSNAADNLVINGGTSTDAVSKAIDDAKPGIIGETIAAQPGMDIERMAKMLGPQLYGDQSEQASITIKELMQNSFDAIKPLLDNKSFDKGRIQLLTDQPNRTISIIDDGSGMSPDTLATKFLEIAGTQKESDIASGGFGIAKMLTLYANKDIHVTTMRDGKVSELNTTGDELMRSLSSKSDQPPISISIRSPTPEDLIRFPEGHGTHVRITVPESYVVSSTGETKDIYFPYDWSTPTTITRSPLFANIDVIHNNRPIEGIGSTFPVNDYQQFANIKYPWGNARIYVSNKSDPDMSRYANNITYLSNGLYQFDSKLQKNPLEMFGDAIPYNFYVDIRPNVKPGKAGYPFTFNRKALTPEAKNDLDKVINYLHKQYSYKSLSEESSNFGGIRYFNLIGKLGNLEKIEPKIAPPKSKFDAISAGSNVEVKNGIIYVDGKETPELTPEDLAADVPKSDSLTVPQEDINPNKVMVHDNLSIDTPEGTMEVSDYMRQKFGDRYNKYIYGLGSNFIKLRNLISEVMGYSDLLKEGVGISIDKEYRGVSIRVPFSASFLNPLIPESSNPIEAAYGFVGTMVHEMAHHKVRSHNASFPAEMQKIEYKLQANKESEYRAIKNAVLKIVRDNADIMAEGKRIYEHESISPNRKRLQDSEERIQPVASNEGVSQGNIQSSGAVRAGERILPSAVASSGDVRQRGETGVGSGGDEEAGSLAPQYQTRHKAPYERDPFENMTPEERKTRAENIIKQRANAEQQKQNIGIPKTLEEMRVKVDDWWKTWKHEQQNILSRQLEIENNLDLRDKLVVSGPKANNVYMRMSSADARFEYYGKIIDGFVNRIFSAMGDYAKLKGFKPQEASSAISSYLTALDAYGWRRQELFNRYRPLSERVVPDAKGSKSGLSPAELRRNLYDLANKTAGDLTIPKEQRIAKLKTIKDHISEIVNDDRNVDEKGHSYLPNRGEDAYGNPARIPANFANPIYHPAAGLDPYTTREFINLMEADLAHPIIGPALKKVLDLYKSLVKQKIRYEKIAGNWHEHLDDITKGLYGADNYAPMKSPRGDVDPTDLEGTRNLGDVAGLTKGMEGGRHMTENVIYQMIYDTYRAAAKASKEGVTLAVKNLIDNGELAGAHIATIPAADRFLNPDIYEQYPEAKIGGTISHINKNGDTDIYRVDDQRFLDGLRRPNIEMNAALRAIGWVTNKIASQLTRFRLAFAPFVTTSHILGNILVLPAQYNNQISRSAYTSQVITNLFSGNGFKSYQAANLYNQNRLSELKAWAAKDPWIKDCLEWMQGGGPAAHAHILYPTMAPQRLKDITSGNIAKKSLAAIDMLFDNWNRSFDNISRVTAYSLVKRIELDKGRSPLEARQIAVKVAKDLSNFNLRGKDPTMRTLYAFWGPASTTLQITVDNLIRPALMSDAAIEKAIDEVLPEEDLANEEKRDEIGHKYRFLRSLTRGLIKAAIGSGFVLYAMNYLYCEMSPWGKDSQGRNFLVSDDKSRSIRGMRIPLPNGQIFQPPFGFFQRTFIAPGYQTCALLMGHQSFKQYVSNMGRVAAESSPTQMSSKSPLKNFFGFLLDTIAPTSTKLIVDLAMNSDSMGHPIYNTIAGKLSDAYSGGQSIPELYKEMADYAYRHLNMNLSPNALYSTATNLFDGIAEFAGMGNDLRLALEGEKNISPKIFLGSFVGTKSDMDAQDYTAVSDKIIDMRQHLAHPDKAFVAEWISKNPLAPSAVATYNSGLGNIKKLQQEATSIRTNPYFTPQIKKELLDINRDQLDVSKRIIVDKLHNYGIDP